MKLNKKGFTLIEILAIVVLIGVVAVIAIPNITKQADDHAAKQNKLMEENIKNAAKIAASSEIRIDDNGCITDDITVKTNVEKLLECTTGTCMEFVIHLEDPVIEVSGVKKTKYTLVNSELLTLSESNLEKYNEKTIKIEKDAAGEIKYDLP